MHINIMRCLLKPSRVTKGFYKSARNICNLKKTLIYEQNTIFCTIQGRKSVNNEIVQIKSYTKTLNMELEEFEYAVTYPKITDIQFDSKERNENADTRIPVILLFGWANCKDKHLAKYSKMYEDKGMISIRYCLPNQYFFWEPSKMPIVGTKVVNLIFELKLDQHPILIHCFSNGGSTVYLNLSKALDKNPRPINIKGIIFDSAPGNRRLIGYFRVVSEVYREQKRRFATLRAFLVSAGVSIIWTGEKIYNLADRKGTDGYLDVCRYLNSEKYRWPQHFIYSKIDNIVDAPDIEQFMECRKKLGIDVTSLSFNDSPHVSHYMYHKDEYTKSVLDFMEKCLNKQTNEEAYHTIKSKL